MRAHNDAIAAHGRLALASLPCDASRHMDVHMVFEDVAHGRARITVRFEPNDAPNFEGVFDITAPFAIEEPATHDAALLLALWPALQRGGELRIHGPISRRLLRNMRELQSLWVMARPDLARPFAIVADIVLAEVPQAEHDLAILPLSGGVDSMLSLCQHTDPERPLGEATVRVGAALFLPGYSPRIDRREEFPAAIASVRALATTHDLPLVVVECDWTDRCPPAAFLYGSLLASVSTMLSRHYRRALIGSTVPHQHATLSYGGSAASIDLFHSSGAMDVHSDVNDMYRAEKLSALRTYPEMLERINVCFETVGMNANCCRCEKCTRTMLQCLSQGMEIPAKAFPLGLSAAHVGKRMRRLAVQVYSREALADARTLGVTHPMLRLLRRRYRFRRLKYLARLAATRWLPGVDLIKDDPYPPRWLIERRARAQLGGATSDA